MSENQRVSSPSHRLGAALAAALLVTLLSSSASAQYIYVANGGEDTVSKIDINTNQEVARYATWFTSGINYVPHPNFPWSGPAPSRLLVDSAGNLYVLNRFFGNHLPVLLKISPAGGNPGLTTSNSPAALPVLDLDSDNHLDPGEATDVRILWAAEIGAVGADENSTGRALCMDPGGTLWVGLNGTKRYYRVNPANGQMIGGPVLTPNHRPYGCQVDLKGRLWSVENGKTLAEIDTATGQVTVRSHGTPTDFGNSYSVSLYNSCDTASSKVYMANTIGNTYIGYDPQTATFSAAPLPAGALFASAALGVDKGGNILSGLQAPTGRVIKSSPTGAILWDTNTPPAGLPTLPSNDLHGIIIDDNNDVWAVHMREDRVVKYSGVDGHHIATVPVGDAPYTYGNPPPPNCPCAEISEHPITCEKQSGGVGTYAWSFTFTNQSPFSTPATSISITSTQVANLNPTQVQFTNPVPPKGQATVSGTFTVANPVPGSVVCLDVRLNAGEGWCCPVERVCFRLPECPGTCAKLQAKFICEKGKPVLGLYVTNQGPTAAQSAQFFSNTPGVSVSPQTVTQTFPPGTPTLVPLTFTGASPNQAVSFSVIFSGPTDPKTGVSSWCCTSTLTVNYPKLACATSLDGWVFEDLDRDGIRDSAEGALTGWTLTLTDARGTPRMTTSGVGGTYRFENVEQGTYRLTLQPLRGWRPTTPEAGFYTVTVPAQSERTFDFGFTKSQP